ncbi:ribonuclease P protein component [Hylemonella gracilis]|uniref:Ribonuclease P protein component n=1 Tax=Hylemonella gracilis TaxID=80880 RepID=A0A4P6UIR8_9BURK|nr:ribonuclease P protein component [Hylemonella gracilis]QBK03980.1 ribonuclease P protein component [Hylemonella gracilis]
MKARRLRAQPQFEALRSSPSLARTEHFVLHGLALQPSAEHVADQMPALFPGEGPWLGAVTPKRWAKRAVTRNLIRRQIYGVGQAHVHALRMSMPQSVFLVRLKTAYGVEQFRSAASTVLRQAVRAELERLFARAAGLKQGRS